MDDQNLFNEFKQELFLCFKPDIKIIFWFIFTFIVSLLVAFPSYYCEATTTKGLVCCSPNGKFFEWLFGGGLVPIISVTIIMSVFVEVVFINKFALEKTFDQFLFMFVPLSLVLMGGILYVLSISNPFNPCEFSIHQIIFLIITLFYLHCLMKKIIQLEEQYRSKPKRKRRTRSAKTQN